MAKYRGVLIDSVNFDPKAKTFALFDEAGDIVAELKQQEYLSQPSIRSLGHTNGRHRKTYPQVYSRPARQSGLAIDWGTLNFPSIIAGSWFSAADFDPEPAIEHAGIRAGEIVGLRAWRVEGDRLFSVYIKNTEWLPGERLRGNSRDTRNQGVHAFKKMGDVEQYLNTKRLAAMMNMWDRFTIGYVDGVPTMQKSESYPDVFVIGTVALWGEIVEHERGYRAEFAKIASLDSVDIIGAGDKEAILARVRERYALPSSVNGEGINAR